MVLSLFISKLFKIKLKKLLTYLNVLTHPAVRAHSGLCIPSGRDRFQVLSCTPSPGLNTTWILTPFSIFTPGLTTQPEGPGSSSEDNEVIGTGFISHRVNPLTGGNVLMSIMKKKILKSCYNILIYQLVSDYYRLCFFLWGQTGGSPETFFPFFWEIMLTPMC